MARKWSHDPNTLWEQMLQKPVHGFSDHDLSEELDYWHQELSSIYAEVSGPFASKLLEFSKWGGLTFAVVGIPVVFAGVAIGLPIAVGGLVTVIFGHLSAKRKRARDDDLKIRTGLIVTRLQQIEELRKQWRRQPQVRH